MKETWPLWQCLRPKALVVLIVYQWQAYGLWLGLLADMYKDIETLEEIKSLMKIPARRQGG